MRPDKLKVLFLCTGNACRSQMAEGFARALRGDVIDAYSAGITPHGKNPLAVRVMAEAGIDISAQESKHIDSLKHVPLDVVVTVCGSAHEACPIFPGRTRVVHVGFEDPPALARASGASTDEQALPYYRKVRDQIRAWILTLPGSLAQP